MAKFAKLVYKASVDGTTVEQQIIDATYESIYGDTISTTDFTRSLRYDLTNTVCGILSSTSIKYSSGSTPFTESLQKNLIDIFFILHRKGEVFMDIEKDGRIKNVNDRGGSIKITDKAYSVTKITQLSAVEQQLKMYDSVSNARYSIINERGMLGVFSPKAGAELKQRSVSDMYEKFRTLFGIKKGQRKFAVLEVPMDYSGVSIPVAELNLLENEKQTVARIAHIMGIEEDMILSGSTFDNKERAIIQTYANFKGKVYDWIMQIEKQLLFSFNIIENYTVSFSESINQQTK